MSAPLTRGARKPVRLVHLGLGAFFRAHQARLTQLAADGAEWGYAAFTARSPRQAELLAKQDALYTLTERSQEGDAVDVVDQISAVHDGADLDALRMYLARPEVAVVTLTITEGGYEAAASDAPPAVADDIERIRAALGGGGPIPTSPLARLAVALDARRVTGGGPIAVVPCDNLPGNGDVARRAIAAYASASPALGRWIEENVSFVSTAVDRITPRLTPAETRGAALRAGRDDAAPVVTEPYVEWVLAGAFPAGRPRWETSGAVFASDIEPYERRKLRMLNGAHTLLAVAGLRRGLATVDEAIAVPEISELVDAWWAEAGSTLPADLDAPAYARALRARFANPRLRHALAQIAENGTVKLETRVLPVLRARRDEGRACPAGHRVLAEWARAVEEGVLPADRDSAAAREMLAEGDALPLSAERI